MGRLMDDIQALFGLKPSDRVISQEQTSYSPAATDDSSSTNLPTDCLSCKAVTAATCTGLSIYVAYAAYLNKPQYIGRQKVAFRGFALSMASGLMLLGISRVTNTGPFAKENQGLSLLDQSKRDVATLYRAAGKEPPKIFSEDEKES